MAGYVFALGGQNPIDILKDVVEKGVFSSRVSLHYKAFEGTMADYLSMKPGDNIYFFSKRTFYGVGELVQLTIEDKYLDCKFCNFPHSSALKPFDYKSIKKSLLVDFGLDSPNYRWIYTFKGSPAIYDHGVDMDEVLSYKPHAFKMIRAFQGLSFIKIDEEENQALKEILLLKNRNNQTGTFTENPIHAALAKQIIQNDYEINCSDLLKHCHKGNEISHELALEVATVNALAKGNLADLGKWDYIARQVVASPIKPVIYMDKIDVFAINFLQIPGYKQPKVPCRFLILELKRGSANDETVDQIMKYVDWVCKTYAYGDYDLIDAAIIAHEIPPKVKQYSTSNAIRNYTQGTHPSINKCWNSLKFYEYRYDEINENTNFIPK